MKPRAALGLGVLLCIVALLTSFWVVPLPSRLVQPDSPVVLWRTGELAHTFLSPDERWRLAGDPSTVDPAYLTALLAIEDERFEWHLGVDPLAIARATLSNLTAGRVVSGASTLTMQLARLLEPRPRLLSSKIVEAWRAMQLHMRIGRRAVLGNYLRFLPFGGNLEGVQGASFAYFGHPAKHLDAAEIATLLAVPQRPGRRAASARNTERLREARNAVLKRMAQAGLIDETVLKRSLVEPVPTKRRKLPRHIPHAARWLRAQHPPSLSLQSSLDRDVQTLAKDVFNQGAMERRSMAVEHGAVVVVDHHTRQIRALVGGADFFAKFQGSQIPAFNRPRHAASSLKPLLLGLAIDRGLAAPDQRVEDLPLQIGGYRPRNFDGRFNGLVRLSDALARSLNIPFINLIRQVGVENFVGRLRNSGLAYLDPTPEFYGLAAALGTIPITPLELASLYAAIAQDGSVQPLGDLANEEPAEGISVISPEAAWLLRQILRSRDRPDFPGRARLHGMDPSIHWKTGTSFGFRDAWSVGSDEHYTIAVWLGNLDRKASRYLVGAPLAGPLLFDVFDALGHQDRERYGDAPPGGMVRIEICRFSGHLPGPGCSDTEETWAPRKSISVTPCPYHRRMWVRPQDRVAYPQACAPKDASPKSVLVLPARVREFSAELLPDALTMAPDCESRNAEPLEIISPVSQTVVIIPGMPANEQEIALQAKAAEGTELSWFINGSYLGSSAAQNPLWWKPEPGMTRIVVMDAAGRKARKVVRVR